MSEMPRHVEVFFGEHRAWAGELSGPQDDETVANMPVNLELEQLRGRYGRTA